MFCSHTSIPALPPHSSTSSSPLQHYADLKTKGFFPGLIAYMTSGPVVAMAWEGKNAAAVGRQLLGATKPSDSAPGTIRFDFALDVGRNLLHGSDSPASAEKEIALWFPEGLTSWKACTTEWVYE